MENKEETKEETKETKNKTPAEKSYSKEQLLKSKDFKVNRDLLNALLQEDKKYTKSETARLVKLYMESEV